MTYRELIELYKNGKLEDEQKEMVENDIERQDAISEYLFEEGEIPGMEDVQRDNLKNELSESELMDNHDEEALKFEKMIKSSIRKAFIKMGAAVGVIVLAIVMLVIFAVPQIMDSFYYDPSENVGNTGDLTTNRMALDFATYSELFLPEYYRDKVIVDGNGSGNYDINILQTSSGTGVFTNVAGKIEKGKMTLYDANLLKRPSVNAFVPHYSDLKNMWEVSGAAGSYSDAKKTLRNLDENDYYLAYVTLDEIKKYPQFVDWCKKNEVDPDWCAICLKRDGEYYLDDGAFGFIYSSSCSDLNYDKDAYPYLSVFDVPSATDASEDVMISHVVSVLRYMAKQTAFNKMIESGYSADYYSDTADNVAKNGLNIYGFTVVAQKSTLLKISEADDVAYIYTKPMK